MRLSFLDSLFHVQNIPDMDIQELHRVFLSTNGICIDSRNTISGSIFFAIRGENFDGNKFATEAIQKGCALAVVDDQSLPVNKRFLKVKDTLGCLQQLANYHRRQLHIPILALTGSNGKTTTKELCHTVLNRKFRVLATKGNLNNHIGVPLTLLSIKDEEIAIIEMGANHPGEISTLCSIAEPNFGIITNIGLAHLEGFGSPEGVKNGKAELYDFIRRNNGKAFYHASDPVLTGLIHKKKINSIPYGDHPGSLCRGKIINNEFFLSAELFFSENEKVKINSQLIGNYNLENIIASAAVGRYFGVPVKDIIKAIENYSPSNNRSQYLTTKKNKLILDAYNANPSSMRSALLNFLAIKDPLDKAMILGDMLELGEYADEEHDRIISLLKENSFRKVFLVGPIFRKAAGKSGFNCFEKPEELIDFFRKNEIKDHFIFIKGSRGIKLEKIIDYL